MSTQNELNVETLQSSTYTQELSKAWVLPITYKGYSWRLYAPYRGNLTPAKKEKVFQSLKDRCELLGVPFENYGWKTKDVRLVWPEGDDVNAYVSYQEDGAGGSLRRKRVFVCNTAQQI